MPHGCRGSKVASTNRNFAFSTSTQEGLVLVYGEDANPRTDLKQLDWSLRSDRIIARQRNGSLLVFNVSHKEIEATCADTTSTMACNPTVEFLVTGDRKGTMKVRRISDFALLYQMQGSESVTALSVAPNSGTIYDICGTNCTVWEPSLATCKVRKILTSPGASIIKVEVLFVLGGLLRTIVLMYRMRLGKKHFFPPRTWSAQARFLRFPERLAYSC